MVIDKSAEYLAMNALVILDKYATVSPDHVQKWVDVGSRESFPANGGACVKHGDLQIAVFNFSSRSKWYACQNLCPHKFEMVIGRGLIGDEQGAPKVACPLHKNNFSLESGEHLNGDLPALATYPVKIDEGRVLIGFTS